MMTKIPISRRAAVHVIGAAAVGVAAWRGLLVRPLHAAQPAVTARKVSTLSAPVRLSRNAPASIYPVRTPELESAWGQGPTASMTVFNAPTYIPERKLWWFCGGGHRGTGLNSVIVYAEDTRLYSLLTAPSPFVHGPSDDLVIGKTADGKPVTAKAPGWRDANSPARQAAGQDPLIWQHPAVGPGMVHTRGGMKMYSTVTRKGYFLSMGEGFDNGTVFGREFWEFDFDDHDGVNRGWTRLPDYPVDMTCVMNSPAWYERDGKLHVYVSTYTPEGRSMVGAFDPATRTWSPARRVSSSYTYYGCGVFDPDDDTLWYHDGQAVFKLPHGGALTRLSTPLTVPETSAWVSRGPYLYTWSRPELMFRIEKASGRAQVLFGLDLPTADCQHVYNGVRISDDGAGFVYSAGEKGMWHVPVPADDMPWQDISTVSAQSLADAGRPIAGGYYPQGLRLNRAAEVTFEPEVWLGGPVGTTPSQDLKAFVLVSGLAERVRVAIAGGFGNSAWHGDANNPSAALRAEGAFDLTVSNFDIGGGGVDDGMLIGNALEVSGTSTVMLRQGTVRNGGYTNRFGFGHAIYISEISSASLENVTTTGITAAGQGVKSRAARTVIRNHVHRDNPKADRCLGFPQGGEVTIVGGLFYMDPGADNFYAIKYGDENPSALHHWPKNTLTFAMTSVWVNRMARQATLLSLPASGTPFFPSRVAVDKPAQIVLIGNWALGALPPEAAGAVRRYATVEDARAGGLKL
jgi:hypothetical protein